MSYQMATVEIDGTRVTYGIAHAVSYNRANPNRLTATCQCGATFMEHACSNRVYDHLDVLLRQNLKRHKASGYCKLVAR